MMGALTVILTSSCSGSSADVAMFCSRSPSRANHASSSFLIYVSCSFTCDWFQCTTWYRKASIDATMSRKKLALIFLSCYSEYLIQRKLRRGGTYRVTACPATTLGSLAQQSTPLL